MEPSEQLEKCFLDAERQIWCCNCNGYLYEISIEDSDNKAMLNDMPCALFVMYYNIALIYPKKKRAIGAGF